MRYIQLTKTMLSRTIFILSCLLFLSACSLGNQNLVPSTTAQASPMNAEPLAEQLSKAETAFKASNYAQALSLYQRLTKIAPDNDEAWFGVAAAADMLGKFDIADAAYEQLKNQHQNSTRYLNNLGYSHMLRGELLIARDYFLQALNIDPHNENAKSNLDMLQQTVNQNNSN